MAKKFLNGSFEPQQPDKYVGTYPIIYRSSWELQVCRMLDNHQNVIAWASESLKIPYTNPLTGKYTVYIPDFMVQFEDQKGNTRLELWEVKPSNQSFVSEAKRPKDKMALAVNAMKWKAAQIWANKNGATFRVITEKDIFRNPK